MICRKCKLAREGVEMVKGSGPLDADLMLIGEAPGEEENKMGIPFIGSAGRLLNNHLKKVGIKREDVYITNVVKCRPPGNRNPTHEETQSCIGHLYREIVSVRPKVVVLMGRVAIGALSGKKGSMKKLHGRISHMTFVVAESRGKSSAPHDAVVVTTYHPAAELYNNWYKQFIDEDWEKIRGILMEEKKLKKVQVQVPAKIDQQERKLEVKKKILVEDEEDDDKDEIKR